MFNWKNVALLIALPLVALITNIEATLPDINAKQVVQKAQEMMKSHASQKKLTPELVARILSEYLDELDPSKTYFIKSDIDQWLSPSANTLETTKSDFEQAKFTTFIDIHNSFIKAIARRHALEEQIDYDHLPAHVQPSEFKDLKWAANENELLERLKKMKSLQLETASKLNGETREKALQRLQKRQLLFETEILEPNIELRQRRIYSNILKATASSLDAHTVYFTPDEAEQFMISVQQRLFGIGAQLRDDVNGFTIVKIIEGGPAWRGKELKVKDRIIAVNGEPVVGMDITSAVELIRGKENTPVTLTVIRENSDGAFRHEETLDIAITRGEVVLKEMRYETTVEPYGDGVIGYLKLFAFYQDPENSSEKDLAQAIAQMKAEYNVKGIVLDLRYNSGGLLSQAVAVTGLFISKGVVVSIKDETGEVQHLRHFEEAHSWEGPLIVLVNRLSASASEIVSGTLQDYGRALIVGDDHTYGKGSFQTFTLNSEGSSVNPQGEYKVTRGRYYTVAGRTPQLTGIQSDIVVPGILSEMDIGEKTAKYPLDNDSIKPNFDDDLSDVPVTQRNEIRLLYKYNMQPKMQLYDKYMPLLIANSSQRIHDNKVYQEFLLELRKNNGDENVEPNSETLEESNIKVDLQLLETYNVFRDLLYLINKDKCKLR
jgi:carboxyl-terminal processing protease